MAKNNSALLEALEVEIEECNDRLNRLGKMRELYLKDEGEKGPEPARRGRKPRNAESNEGATGGSGFPARRPTTEGQPDEADGQ